MSLITSIRNQQTNLINQNKASIVITRTAKTLSTDGAYTTVDTVLASQDFRLYNKKTRVLNVTDGGWHSERLVKMIAKYDADVKRKTATSKDVFTYGGRNYVISDVKNIYTGGSLVFKELELEEVK